MFSDVFLYVSKLTCVFLVSSLCPVCRLGKHVKFFSCCTLLGPHNGFLALVVCTFVFQTLLQWSDVVLRILCCACAVRIVQKCQVFACEHMSFSNDMSSSQTCLLGGPDKVSYSALARSCHGQGWSHNYGYST